MQVPPIITAHARDRMREMKLEDSAIIHALHEPEMDYPAPREHGADARLACCESIAVAYRPHPTYPQQKIVLTVLWNGKEFTRP